MLAHNWTVCGEKWGGGCRPFAAQCLMAYQVFSLCPQVLVNALMMQRFKQRWGERDAGTGRQTGRRQEGRECVIWDESVCAVCPKLAVSNVGPSHFCLIISLEDGHIVPPSYVPQPHPIISCDTLPLFIGTHTLRLPSPPLLLPTSALRAIIIMPSINNASQYINNAGLQHGWERLKEWEVVVEEKEGTDGLFLAQHIIS